MEVIRCPNPKCRRRILDDEGTETEWTVLEIKCQHCGKLVRLYCGPDGIEAGIYEAFRLKKVQYIGEDAWGKMQSGYWVPLAYKGKVRVK